jgi:hypothetical protein
MKALLNNKPGIFPSKVVSTCYIAFFQFDMVGDSDTLFCDSVSDLGYILGTQ